MSKYRGPEEKKVSSLTIGKCSAGLTAPEGLTSPAPTYPSANSQTPLCRRYSFDSPAQSPGCHSTSTDDLLARGRSLAVQLSPDRTASRHTREERSLHPTLHRSHIPVRHQCGCDLPQLQSRA